MGRLELYGAAGAAAVRLAVGTTVGPEGAGLATYSLPPAYNSTLPPHCIPPPANTQKVLPPLQILPPRLHLHLPCLQHTSACCGLRLRAGIQEDDETFHLACTQPALRAATTTC